jgi:hypothetical protein
VNFNLSKLGAALLLFGFFTLSLFAQESTCDLKVNVFTYVGNAPIERAKVSLTDLKNNTPLNSSFIENRFNGITSGSYKIEIAKESYGPRVTEFKVNCNFATTEGIVHQSVYLPGPNDPNTPTQKDANGMGVLKGVPLHFEKPVYPVERRGKEKLRHHVEVKVLIDEDGNVISGEAVNEDSLFGAAALKAAMGAKFQPVRLAGQLIKVAGSITYDFVP